MSITIPADRLLDLLGPNGEHWVKGTFGDDQAMCLHGAIRRCAPQPGDAQLVEQVAARRGWGTDWNDNKATTWADVRARVDHVEVTDADLADTYGPQWEHVVALVRRAAVLTADAAAASAIAAYAAYAAHDACSYAGDAAAAAYAARALVVRHLIGQHGFTQAHYDTLTRPWRTVIGPVHPDDKAVEP